MTIRELPIPKTPAEIKDAATQQFHGLVHAFIDSDVEFVTAKNELTGEMVCLVCFVHREIRPSAVIGGNPEIVNKLVPVAEFIMRSNVTAVYTISDDTLKPTDRELPPAGKIIQMHNPAPVAAQPERN